jgi:hypothetical protein
VPVVGDSVAAGAWNFGDEFVAVGQAACAGPQAGALAVRVQQRGYKNVKVNVIDAGITYASFGFGGGWEDEGLKEVGFTAGQRLAAKGLGFAVTDFLIGSSCLGAHLGKKGC